MLFHLIGRDNRKVKSSNLPEVPPHQKNPLPASHRSFSLGTEQMGDGVAPNILQIALVFNPLRIN